MHQKLPSFAETLIYGWRAKLLGSPSCFSISSASARQVRRTRYCTVQVSETASGIFCHRSCPERECVAPYIPLRGPCMTIHGARLAHPCRSDPPPPPCPRGSGVAADTHEYESASFPCVRTGKSGPSTTFLPSENVCDQFRVICAVSKPKIDHEVPPRLCFICAMVRLRAAQKLIAWSISYKMPLCAAQEDNRSQLYDRFSVHRHIRPSAKPVGSATVPLEKRPHGLPPCQSE